MDIKKGTQNDVERILDAWWEMMVYHHQFDKEEYALVSEEEAKTANAKYRKESLKKDNAVFFIAEEDGKVIGYVTGNLNKNPPIYIKTKIGYVEDLAVTDKVRGRGVGTALLEKAIKEFKRIGVDSIEVHVDPRNRAKDLYERSGFKDHQMIMRLKP